jgi:exopolyphosphatase / guanosine-5'-triphosphate,3'-diphosphate pyrophosphatase
MGDLILGASPGKRKKQAVDPPSPATLPSLSSSISATLEAVHLKAPVHIALIDIGFDAIQLGVFEADALGNQRTLIREQAPVSLGQGVLRTGRIKAEAFQSGLEALAWMAELLRSVPGTSPMVCGGAALRGSANASHFIEESARLGIPIQVISGEEEARLLFEAVRHAFPLPLEPTVLISIEGGSTVLTWLAGELILASIPLPWGPHTLAEALPIADPPTAQDLKRVRRCLRKILKKASRLLPDPLPKAIKALGTQGWLPDLMRLGGSDAVLGSEQLRRLHRRLWRMPAAERGSRFGVDPGHAAILPVGATWVLALLDWLEVQEVQTLPVGRREGLLRTALQRGGTAAPPPLERRRESVETFAAKLDPDPSHSRHVGRLADQLFGDLQASLGLGDAERELLGWAARLHDIGLSIAEKDHHKLGAGLVQNAVLTGFRPKEVELLAQLVRFHRGRAPTPERHEDFARLAPWHRSLVEKLAALLRAADALDRGHRQAVQSVRVRLELEACQLQVQGSGNLQPELEALQEKGTLLFRLLDRPVRIQVSARP